MKKVIFVHGYTSSPTKKKYRIIDEELTKLGVEHSIPAFPGDKYPHSKDWLEIIDKEVSSSELPVVLVGHSLGTRAILLYLDKFNKKVDSTDSTSSPQASSPQVDSVILIGAFNNDFEKNRLAKDSHYPDFFEYALDIEKVKKLADKFIVAHSKDDPAIDYRQGAEIAKELGAQFISYDGMEHFSGEENAERNAKIFLDMVQLVL